MHKKSRKTMVRQMQQDDRVKVLAAMPLSLETLRALLDHLDASLQSCDHTAALTTEFLNAERLETDKVLEWLGRYGGYCDCEVLANLDDLASSLQSLSSSPTRGAPSNKHVQIPRSLQSETGWQFTRLPSPWRVANMYRPTEPLRLSMGKSDGCTITVVESPLRSGDQTSDECWSALWHERTQLPSKGEVRVTHHAIALPHGYDAVLVHATSWTPVYCWVLPPTNTWHLEIRSESSRIRGDLPQIASLISRLESEKA